MTRPSRRLGPCDEYKPDGDGGCHNCVYSHRERPRPSAPTERACGNPNCRVYTYLVLWPEQPQCPGTGCWQVGMPIESTLSDVATGDHG